MRISRRPFGPLLLLLSGGACGESARPPIYTADVPIGFPADDGGPATVDTGRDAGPATPGDAAADLGPATPDAADAAVADDVAARPDVASDVASDVGGSPDAGCAAGQAICAGACHSLATDGSHCGRCGLACAAGVACVAGFCQVAFNPSVNPTYLPAGTHSFTSVRIPAGVVVQLDTGSTSSATLDLQVSGDVVIEGTLDLSGGAGTTSTIAPSSTTRGRAGTGGFTGAPVAAPRGPECSFGAGAPGTGGMGAFSVAGTCPIGEGGACLTSPFVFTATFARGGGGGVFTGLRAYGGGGGGVAGGGPGDLPPIPEPAVARGQVDCMGVTAGGGASGGRGGSAGATPYDGEDGTTGRAQCAGASGIPGAFLGGGGGGSIGAAAAGDLAVATTFQPGSGGGGGSADYGFRPGAGGTSGGGGGGGALRITSMTRITVSGSVLANGGAGGAAYVGTAMAEGCDPAPGAAGGGGSGGVIFLRAPEITTSATARISAVGGVGRLSSPFATGGRSGAGGLGRIRLSVSSAGCMLGGTFQPPLASGCSPSAMAGTTFVAAYPD
ncbi:MAG: hypothetical protein Q8S73_11450 [Deltaproteobacteria bacterium]|nr:hypothetical protein [Myxococcales bacterium]MDP3214713.1 hypothetical protein [Deltaproteobacteria bacterium]